MKCIATPMVVLMTLGLLLSGASGGEEGDRKDNASANAVKPPTRFVEPALPVGTILPFAGDEEPDGFLLCDGRLLSKKVFPHLFKVVRDRYQLKDAATGEIILSEKEKETFGDPNALEKIGYYFRIPNLCGRFPVGGGFVADDAGNEASYVLGNQGGEIKHTLITPEMPVHKHEYQDIFHSTRTTPNYPPNPIEGFSPISTVPVPHGLGGRDMHSSRGVRIWHKDGMADAGEGKSHNNMPPYITVNYIIKY